MALWKARGGSLNKQLGFRSWHSEGKGGSLNKELDLDYGIVDGKGMEV